MSRGRTARLTRKAIIVVLTLAAVGAGVAWSLSLRPMGVYPRCGLLVEGLACWAGDGRLSIFRYTCPDCLSHHLQRHAQTCQYDGQFGRFPPATPRTTEFEIRGLDADIAEAPGIHAVTVHLSLWLPLVGFAAYPVTVGIVAFIRGPLRRYRHRKRGRCIHCGYDLRGTTGGVCSECGSAVRSTR